MMMNNITIMLLIWALLIFKIFGLWPASEIYGVAMKGHEPKIREANISNSQIKQHYSCYYSLKEIIIR